MRIKIKFKKKNSSKEWHRTSYLFVEIDKNL